MKQKSLFGIAICTTITLVVVITLNVNFSKKNSDLSDIILANVEAFAQSENRNCICYGPKSDLEGSTWCACTNDNCCKDIWGCD